MPHRVPGSGSLRKVEDRSSPLDQGGLPRPASGSPSTFTTAPCWGAGGPSAQAQGANTALARPTVTAGLESQPRPLDPAMEAGPWGRPAFSSEAVRLWVVVAGSGGPGGLRDTLQVLLLAADEVCLVRRGQRATGALPAQAALRPESCPQALVGPGALLRDGLRGRQALP